MSWHQKAAVAVLLLVAVVSLVLFVRDWRRAGRRKLDDSIERRMVRVSRPGGDQGTDRGDDT
ncbi:MAG TPA: hypothetical protein VIA06_07940 [Candidatus Dormibacteraeota bacterium]|jgi:hypothetical protein|nr:hypothetical protein [Candidatus Dormibacteraeota bacterium]